MGIANNIPISHYQFSISWQPAMGEEKPAFLSLVIGSMNLDGSIYYVVGQVTNNGDRSVNSIKVSGAFYGYIAIIRSACSIINEFAGN